MYNAIDANVTVAIFIILVLLSSTVGIAIYLKRKNKQLTNK